MGEATQDDARRRDAGDVDRAHALLDLGTLAEMASAFLADLSHAARSRAVVGGLLLTVCVPLYFLSCGGAVASSGKAGVDAGLDAASDATTPDAGGDGAPEPEASADGAVEAEASACEAGLTSCGSVCTDTTIDPANCGSCGHACSAPTNAEVMCSAGVCGFTCEADAGFSDCAGTCEDLTSDPNNCGACGRICASGPSPACANGSCYYAILTSDPQGPDSVISLASDGKNVYWTFSSGTSSDLGAVYSCSVAEGCGGSPTILAFDLYLPFPIATDGVNVYWASGGSGDGQQSGSVESCAVGGCAYEPTVLATLAPNDSVDGVATDGKNVYWTTGSKRVLECAVTGCAGNPTVLYQSQRYPTVVATDGVNVYWSDDSGSGINCNIVECAVGGCPGGPTTLASDQSVASIATDGLNVYWSGFHTVSSCPVTGCPGGPKIVASAASAGSLATDGMNLYWIDVPEMTSPLLGNVQACPVSGCVGPAALSPMQDYPEQVVTTSSSPYVFWSAWMGASGWIFYMLK